MISPTSSSYPILGAAQAAGVSYGLALELAWCVVNLEGRTRWRAAVYAIEKRHGGTGADDLLARLDDAHEEGRLSHRSVA